MAKRLPIVQIRLKILRYLKKLPMTIYDLSIAIGVSYKATLKNLLYLEQLEKVEKYKIKALDKELWRIKQKPKFKES